MGNLLKLKLERLPPVGHVETDQGFTYEVLAAKPHTNRDGAASMIVTWQGTCAECGQPFSFKSGASVYHLARRCPAHNQGWTRAVPYGSPKPEPRAPRPSEQRKAPERGEDVGDAIRHEDLYFPKPVPGGFQGTVLRPDGVLTGSYGRGTETMYFAWHGPDSRIELRDEKHRRQMETTYMLRALAAERERLGGSASEPTAADLLK